MTKPFSKLTKSQKRVAIAKDVLKQIKDGVYNLASCYAHICNSPDNVIDQNAVKAAKECSVCAAGALCLSAIRLGNESTLPNSPGDRKVFAVVDHWFGKGMGAKIDNGHSSRRVQFQSN